MGIALAILMEQLGEDNTLKGTESQVAAARLVFVPAEGECPSINQGAGEEDREREKGSKPLLPLSPCSSWACATTPLVRLLRMVCRRATWFWEWSFTFFRDNCSRECHCGCHKATARSCK